MDAEFAYLFRHGVLRDAAYQLQLPSSRASLHLLAANIIQEAFSAAGDDGSLGTVAAEIAEHVRLARESNDSTALRDRELSMRRIAAEFAEKHFLNSEAVTQWKLASKLGGAYENAESIRRAGVHAMQTGSTPAAREYLEQALVAARVLGDAALEGKTLSNLGALSIAIGAIERSRELLTEARELLVRAENREGLADTLVNLSGVCQKSDNREGAKRLLHEALAIYDQTGNRRNALVVKSRLAMELSEEGKFAESECLQREAIEEARATQDRRIEGGFLINLGTLLEETGRREEAVETYNEALRICADVGNRRGAAVCMLNLGLALGRLGRKKEAEEVYVACLALRRELLDRRGEGLTLGYLATLHRDDGRPAVAEPLFLEALRIHEQVGAQDNLGNEYCQYALCLLALARPDEAQVAWKSGAGFLKQAGEFGDLARLTARMKEDCSELGLSVLLDE